MIANGRMWLSWKITISSYCAALPDRGMREKGWMEKGWREKGWREKRDGGRKGMEGEKGWRDKWEREKGGRKGREKREGEKEGRKGRKGREKREGEKGEKGGRKGRGNRGYTAKANWTIITRCVFWVLIMMWKWNTPLYNRKKWDQEEPIPIANEPQNKEIPKRKYHFTFHFHSPNSFFFQE
jgi:hypothetical protein